jgi:hypothetical protein
VRGTGALYNATAETHQNFDAFWDYYYQAQSNAKGFCALGVFPWTGYNFGLLDIQPAQQVHDFWRKPLWAFSGDYHLGPRELNGTELVRAAFQNTALGFDVKRHSCRGTWKITRSSTELVSGRCDTDPLATEYQCLETPQLASE